MKCDFSCSNDAACHVRWGKADAQQANLCEKHLEDLWEMAKPQVTAGVCFWIQGQVEAKVMHIDEEGI